MSTVAPVERRGARLRASRESSLIRTKRCQAERSPWVSDLKLRRKFFLNLKMSRTRSAVMRGWVAEEGSVSRAFSNSSELGGRMEARLLTSEGSSRSRTERCWTDRTLSMPSRLRPRLRLRKLEMWACLNPVCWASRRPVSSPVSMRSHRILRRLSCKTLNFIDQSITGSTRLASRRGGQDWEPGEIGRNPQTAKDRRSAKINLPDGILTSLAFCWEWRGRKFSTGGLV